MVFFTVTNSWCLLGIVKGQKWVNTIKYNNLVTLSKICSLSTRSFLVKRSTPYTHKGKYVYETRTNDYSQEFPYYSFTLKSLQEKKTSQLHTFILYLLPLSSFLKYIHQHNTGDWTLKDKPWKNKIPSHRYPALTLICYSYVFCGNVSLHRHWLLTTHWEVSYYQNNITTHRYPHVNTWICLLSLPPLQISFTASTYHQTPKP